MIESTYSVLHIYHEHCDTRVQTCFEEAANVNPESQLIIGHQDIESVLTSIPQNNRYDCFVIDLLCESESVEKLLISLGQKHPFILLSDAHEFASLRRFFHLGAHFNVEKRELRSENLYYRIEQAILRQRVIAKSAEKQALALLANEIKSIFLRVVSHSLRTPLNGITVAADLLEDMNLTPEQLELLQLIRSSGQRLTREIENIFDFTEIEQQRIMLVEDTFSPFELLNSAIAQVQQSSLEKDLEFAIRIHPDLGQQLSSDALKIEQILLNLLSNACNASSTGGRIVVELRPVLCHDRSCTIQFTVRDKGVGITAAKQELLREVLSGVRPGFCASNGDSLGLGLPIGYRLAELLGGHLWFDSEEGKGSNFHFTCQVSSTTGSSASQ